MDDERRIRVLVSGLVQGVFFRATVRDTARNLGLTGWVRNLPDGRMEAEFQGDQDALDEAVAFCRNGPDQAHVTDVQVEPLNPVGHENGFHLR